MIEEFIQSLQRTEDEADAVVAAARQKIQVIDDDLQSSLAQLRTSESRAIQELLAEVDAQAFQQLETDQAQLRDELAQRLQELDQEARKRRDQVQATLLKRLL